ncbi:MAG: hypothetical protein ACLPN1_11400 [Dissulfurispiraceae bacterium]|jgi:hypothetical protein
MEIKISCNELDKGNIMKGKPVPEVAKISDLITALTLYIDMHARSFRNPQSEHVFDTPSMTSWDALDWYEVIQDIEVIDFLISGTKEADRLLRSLQSYCKYYRQHKYRQASIGEKPCPT